MNAPEIIVLYREAQGRARNVAHDLDDFEWIDRSPESAKAQLVEILEESRQVVAALSRLVEAP